MFKVKKKQGKRFQELGIILALLAMLALFSILNPRFMSVTNMLNMGRQVSVIGIIAIGMTFLIIGGNFDLSVGSMFAFVSTVVALLIRYEINVLVAMTAGIALGAACGLLNGVLTTFGKIPSFVVGLGMLNVYRGAQLLITGASPALVEWSLGGIGMNFFAALGRGRVLGIPAMLVVYLLLTIVGWFILKKTKFGFRTYAIGASPYAAEIVGIRVKWVQAMAFLLTGVAVAIASMLQLSFLGSVTGQVGVGYELDAIAAVVIGGTKLSGGEGTLIGTLIGAIMMGALRNGLVMAGVSAFWQILIIGVVILVAVALDKWTTKEQ